MTTALPGQSPAADDERRRALRRMQALALALLGFAAVVYLATRELTGWWGYVNAGAEASMVGAIADWFAVTAIFRHPLGLPIPHTALIPRRKDDLGRGLRDFVGENFLAEGVIRDRVEAAGVSGRVGAWLAAPENARRIVDEAADLAVIGLARIDDEQVAAFVDEAVVPRFRAEPISPLLGTLLSEVLADDLHRGAVDLLLDELLQWLHDNPDTFSDVLAERAPWWAPPRLNTVVTGRVHGEVVRWVSEIRDDPRHPARVALDSLLSGLADDLLHDADTAQRAEAFKQRVLDHPQAVATGVSLWQAFRRALQDALGDPEGALRARVRQAVTTFAGRLAADAELRGRLDGQAADLAVFLVDRYGAELTAVISHTIERWDGEEAAKRIELHVGRDLQFVRINGTIVGGLVGVAIHAVSVLLT